jgi:hypothetical protein
MPALGQKRKCPGSRGTSVLPSGADIVSLLQQFRLVPNSDIASSHSITSSAERKSEEVRLHLAYRWFCRFDLDDNVPAAAVRARRTN